MFDVGFWELILIAVVALLVVGPERLPELASTVGRWVGKARRFVSVVKADIDREINEERLKKVMNQTNEDRYEIIDEVKDEINQISDSLKDIDAAVKSDEQQKG